MEPTLEDYMVYVTTSPSAQVRSNAAWILGRQRDMRVVQPLIEAARDADETVRMRVAESLGNLRFAAEMSSATLLQLLSDDVAEVRAQAARSLGLLRAAIALPGLIAAASDEAASVRSQAIEALGLIPDDAAQDLLIEALLHDEDANVRYAASQSLAQMDSPALAARLGEMLPVYQDDPDRLLDLLNTLARLNAPQPGPLAALLDHPDADVRAMAAWLHDRLTR